MKTNTINSENAEYQMGYIQHIFFCTYEALKKPFTISTDYVTFYFVDLFKIPKGKVVEYLQLLANRGFFEFIWNGTGIHFKPKTFNENKVIAEKEAEDIFRAIPVK